MLQVLVPSAPARPGPGRGPSLAWTPPSGPRPPPPAPARRSRSGPTAGRANNKTCTLLGLHYICRDRYTGHFRIVSAHQVNGTQPPWSKSKPGGAGRAGGGRRSRSEENVPGAGAGSDWRAKHRSNTEAEFKYRGFQLLPGRAGAGGAPGAWAVNTPARQESPTNITQIMQCN